MRLRNEKGGASSEELTNAQIEWLKGVRGTGMGLLAANLLLVINLGILVGLLFPHKGALIEVKMWLFTPVILFAFSMFFSFLLVALSTRSLLYEKIHGFLRYPLFELSFLPLMAGVGCLVYALHLIIT